VGRIIISFGPGKAEFRERWRSDPFAIWQVNQQFILSESVPDEYGGYTLEDRGAFTSFADARAALDRWELDGP
jgi:hypothetical protein